MFDELDSARAHAAQNHEVMAAKAAPDADDSTAALTHPWTEGDDHLEVASLLTSHTVLTLGGDDYLTVQGTLATGVIDTGSGNDHVTVAQMAGDAAIHLGAGDDVLTLGQFISGSADGGAGFDTLQFGAGGNVTRLGHFSHFEKIDLGQSFEKPNVLTIEAQDVLANHDADHRLWIEGDAGHKVVLWQGAHADKVSLEQVDGKSYYAYDVHIYGQSYSLMIEEGLYQQGVIVLPL